MGRVKQMPQRCARTHGAPMGCGHECVRSLVGAPRKNAPYCTRKRTTHLGAGLTSILNDGSSEYVVLHPGQHPFPTSRILFQQNIHTCRAGHHSHSAKEVNVCRRHSKRRAPTTSRRSRTKSQQVIPTTKSKGGSGCPLHLPLGGAEQVREPRAYLVAARAGQETVVSGIQCLTTQRANLLIHTGNRGCGELRE